MSWVWFLIGLNAGVALSLLVVAASLGLVICLYAPREGAGRG